MVPDSVTLGDHALHKLRIPLAVVVCHEEHRPDVLFFQRIKDIGGLAVFVALVKGQPDTLPVAFPDEQPAQLSVLLLRLYRPQRAVLRVCLHAHAVGNLCVVEVFEPRIFGYGRSRSGDCRHCYRQNYHDISPFLFRI